MRYVKNVIIGFAAIGCIAAGAYMAINGQGADTWGWFLFAGVVLGYYTVNI